MANNYLQFSEVLPQLTDDEETWLRQKLEHVFVFGEREYAKDELPEGLNADDADWSGIRAWRNLDTSDTDWLGFEYEFDDDSDKWGRHLWIYSEECGEPVHVAHLVQEFLKRFRADQCWSLTYALTCSKLRVGEFTGGGCFVTADTIQWQNSDAFVAKQRQVFAKTKEGPKPLTSERN